MSQEYEYSHTTPSTSIALSSWRFASFKLTNTRVIPDGCRDLIVSECADGEASAFISELSEVTYSVQTDAGSSMSGMRLKPGVAIDEAALLGFLACRPAQDLLPGDRFEEFCRCSSALTEVLACLASGRPVGEVARELGVSTRTLQRMVVTGTGKPPSYWRSLARARLAAKALAHMPRLADAAGAFGFSDQAHLSREMRRWFGQSPSAIRRDDELFALLQEPGYATGVIGEQISIRNPLRSVT